MTLGIGASNVISVPTDANGHMLVPALRNAILLSLEQGKRPFMVVATAGTTVFGAFDPLDAVADEAHSFGLWFHVDGSWGGSLIFAYSSSTPSMAETPSSSEHPASTARTVSATDVSGVCSPSPTSDENESSIMATREWRERMAGVERADSFVMNPHKAMCVPLLCSMLLLRDTKLLQCNRVEAAYLYHTEITTPFVSPVVDGGWLDSNTVNDGEFQSVGMNGTHPSLHSSSTRRRGSVGNVLPISVDRDEVNWDLGRGTLGCGRRADILKLYLTYCMYGPSGIRDHITRVLYLSQWFAKLLSSPHDYGLKLHGVCELINEKPEFCNVCFYFYPTPNHTFVDTGDLVSNTLNTKQSLREKDFNRWSRETETTTQWMHQELFRRGQFMVDYAPMIRDGTRVWPYGWRIVIQHRLMTENVLLAFLRELDEIGQAYIRTHS